MSNAMTLWQPDRHELVPRNTRKPKSIARYAAQLSVRDQRQIVSAFNAEHYEMGLNFLWLRTITALKRELATVGVGLLGEMIGRVDVSEDDDVEDLLTARDAIRLAEELGAITGTDALRLRHTHELVTHFNQLAVEEEDSEEIDESEAISSLKACVSAVLARPRIEVAKKFIEFRESLETESFLEEEEKFNALMTSPYFFWKLTIDILMNSAKESSGAKLEHCLANINFLLPKLWPNLKDAERWRVGRTYSEVYSEGNATSTSGLKQGLLKVQGFDFVPESLRSDTFIKAAESILRAHDGFNNFYNEVGPTRNFSQLGTSIPAPALATCFVALLSVYLGNQYGCSFGAVATTEAILDGISNDRWRYYLNQVLPVDTRTLNKLVHYERARKRWNRLVDRYSLGSEDVKDQWVSRVIARSKQQDDAGLGKAATKVLSQYYGKKK